MATEPFAHYEGERFWSTSTEPSRLSFVDLGLGLMTDILDTVQSYVGLVSQVGQTSVDLMRGSVPDPHPIVSPVTYGRRVSPVREGYVCGDYIYSADGSLSASRRSTSRDGLQR